MSTFTNPVNEYRREYDTMNVAMGDLVETLKISKGISHEEATTYVMKVTAPDGTFPVQNPELVYLRS